MKKKTQKIKLRGSLDIQNIQTNRNRQTDILQIGKDRQTNRGKQTDTQMRTNRKKDKQGQTNRKIGTDGQMRTDKQI